MPVHRHIKTHRLISPLGDMSQQTSWQWHFDMLEAQVSLENENIPSAILRPNVLIAATHSQNDDYTLYPTVRKWQI